MLTYHKYSLVVFIWGDFTRHTSAINHINWLENHLYKILMKSPRGIELKKDEYAFVFHNSHPQRIIPRWTEGSQCYTWINSMPEFILSLPPPCYIHPIYRTRSIVRLYWLPIDLWWLASGHIKGVGIYNLKTTNQLLLAELCNSKTIMGLCQFWFIVGNWFPVNLQLRNLASTH